MKTREEIEAELAHLESDPELAGPLVTIQENAELSLEQLNIKSRCAALRWVLEMPFRWYHGRDKPGEPFEV